MSLLQDAKHAALRALTGSEGHVNDLEVEFLVLLGAARAHILDMWAEVFDTAVIPAGQHNDRAVQYITAQVGAPPSEDYNAYWLHYWQNVTIGPVVPVPPLLANLLHWFDFSDPLVNWQDAAGTVPIVAGQDVVRTDNKGTDGTPLIEAFPPGGIWTENLVNDLAGLVNNTNFSASQQTGWLGAGGAVASMAFSWGRRTDNLANASTGVMWQQGGGGGDDQLRGDSVVFPPGDWAVAVNGIPTPTSTTRAIVNDEWNWIYQGADNLGVITYRASGSPKQTAGGYGGPSGPPSTMSWGLPRGEQIEILVYDRGLTAAEQTMVTDYFDARAGQVMPFIGLPSTVADLIHWFDFTDPATVFKNPPATQQAADGDFIRNVANKGTDGTPINSSTDGVSPILRTGIVNGLQVADYDGFSKTLDAVVAAGHSSSTLGLSMAIVFRWISGVSATNTMAAWENNLSRTTAIRAGQFFVQGAPGAVHSLAPLGASTWYMGMMAFDAAGLAGRWQFSGEALQTAGLGFLTDVTPGSIIEVANAGTLIQVAEVAFWDGQLSVAEIGDLFDYADEKYGTLPIAPPPPPPAPGNLIHHVEPGDASTVWADAAGTIPAINGGVVARIDNKGTNGTPLATSTGGPIYRVGNLNGTNTIEFSGARLEALAVAAGLTISTTGFTIAMVTRRRASHFGDSILWRWTPFAGTPGPSLRGKFTLNGNFGRTDPLADEGLVPDPSVIDQWYLMYWSVDPAGAVDDAKFGSPGPEIITPFGVPTDIAPASDVRYGTSSTLVEHAEAWFWDRPLTLAERAALVALADAKYGTLPHL